MAKDKKDKKYPAAFDDTDCNGDGNCKDCADKDICDVPDDEYCEFSDDDFYEDFENKSLQLGI